MIRIINRILRGVRAVPHAAQGNCVFSFGI